MSKEDSGSTAIVDRWSVSSRPGESRSRLPTPASVRRQGHPRGHRQRGVVRPHASLEESREMSVATREAAIASMRSAVLANLDRLSRMAVDETGLGRFEDKVRKNRLVATRTPGTEDLRPVAYSGDHGLTLVERAPYGIIGSITPSTNPDRDHHQQRHQHGGGRQRRRVQPAPERRSHVADVHRPAQPRHRGGRRAARAPLRPSVLLRSRRRRR